MRPRLVLRLPHKTPLRAFTHHTSCQGARPQLPFLSIPTAARRAQRVRYLTTERKRWIRYEFRLGLQYTVYFWVAAVCLAAGTFAVQQEVLERRYPTPHEWRFLTRTRLKSAHAEKDGSGGRNPDWVTILELARGVVERLEDPHVDGAGLVPASSDGPPGTKDISAMPEPWRRGYFEAHMLYALASERLDGWVLDKTRDLLFPPEVVVGPSHPHPKPIPPGSKSAPREEDCEVAYASPNDLYTKILSTAGLTDRQRMDAALAYANWLEFKGYGGPASIMYEQALDTAISARPKNTPPPVDRQTLAFSDSFGPPTANILTALTALATFQARAGNVSTALPILVSVLRARRSLGDPDSKPPQARRATPSSTSPGHWLVALLTPPEYPPPPDDGNAPPTRDAEELCHEAALHLHIGEIMYAARRQSREEGLAWTRDAVDLAEEQLHRLGPSGENRAARATCRECLATGLDNWSAMVARLAREETVKKENQEKEGGQKRQKQSSWFGLWGGGSDKPEDLDRWAAETRVIRERKKRAAELLDDLEPLSGVNISVLRV